MPKVRWYQNILIIFCFFVYFFPFKAYGFDPRLLVFLFFFIYMIKDGLLLNNIVSEGTSNKISKCQKREIKPLSNN